MHATKKLVLLTTLLALAIPGLAMAEEFQLITGVSPGTSPGPARVVTSTSGGTGGFTDGQRLGGTASATAIVDTGQITYIQTPNQFGSLSFMFRRGSVHFGGPATPFISTDFLGGPLLDLDGDLGNGSRSLVPVVGQTPVAIPGSTSYVDLAINKVGGTIGLDAFDANGNNAGFGPVDGDQLVTVNTLAGTTPTGLPGSAINPTIDTRQGTVTAFTGSSGTLAGVSRIEGIGNELWQDAITPNSSTPDTLGTNQYLGEFRGWLIERDEFGNFPTLAGEGLGGTLWSLVDTSQVGNTFNTACGIDPTVTIADGRPGLDVFSDAGNGGLPLTDFGGDLGAYFDSVVIPNVDPLSQSFVYLESAGFGMNNSPDPVFLDSVGYDVVLVAQSEPIPEPGTLALLLLGGFAVRRRRA
jgi:hypothetical protein